MTDLRRQGIAVDNDNEPTPESIRVPQNTPLPQLEEENIWIT